MIRRLLFAGSRGLPLAARPWVRRHLFAELHAMPAGGLLVVVHGACPTGADCYAADWVEEGKRHGAPVLAEPWAADWDSCAPSCPSRPHRRVKKPGDVHHPGRLPDYCPGAGPRRNAQMVAAGAQRMLAVPWGSSYGTWGCTRLAKAAGLPVDVVRL